MLTIRLSQSMKRAYSPEYLGSSFSSFRRRVCTSGGTSGAEGAFSSAWAAFAASSFPLSLPEAVSAAPAFSLGRGVPDLLGCSSSSPMTNSGSNSEGSGPFPLGAALPPLSVDFEGRFEGDRFRDVDRLGTEPERERDPWAEALCFACSSAILASSAPLMRFGVHGQLRNRSWEKGWYLKALKHVGGMLYGHGERLGLQQVQNCHDIGVHLQLANGTVRRSLGRAAGIPGKTPARLFWLLLQLEIYFCSSRALFSPTDSDTANMASVQVSLPLPVLPQGWAADRDFKPIGHLSDANDRNIEPVGPHFLAHARRVSSSCCAVARSLITLAPVEAT